MNLLSIIWDVNPVAIPFGLNGGVRWYGILWAVGIYLAYMIQQKLYKHENLPVEWPDKLFYWIVCGAIIGARLGHCWFYEWHWTDDPIQIFAWNIHYRNPYIEHPLWLLRIWEGGLASHGGAIGIVLACWGLNKYVFAPRNRELKIKTSMIWILDRLIIGVCLCGMCIRLGNLMNSEIYGGPTSLPWGFVFVRDGQTEACHPTQIYEMLYCIVGFVVLWWMYWKREAYKKTGLLFGVGLEVIFGTRFLLEFIKLNQEAFEAGMLLNMGQLLSIPFILWGAWCIYHAEKA